MAQVVINDPKFERPITYYMDNNLKQKLETKIIPALEKKDKDRVIIVDGNEGAGKSTFAFQLGKFVDPTLNLDRVVFNANDFKTAILGAKKGQCVIYDEAFTGLSSRATLSAINKALVSLMMQMRQKNLFVIIVLPTIFLLDKYAALFRTIALFHIYEVNGHRGYFKVYNRRKKKALFLSGKNTYSYFGKNTKTKFRGRFYGVFALGDEETELAYRKKKETAMEQEDKEEMTPVQLKYLNQRNILIATLRDLTNMSYKELGMEMEKRGFKLDNSEVVRICQKLGLSKDKNIKLRRINLMDDTAEPENAPKMAV